MMEPTFRLLVVEDDPLIRKLLLKVIGDLGHEAIEAKNGEEALESLRRESFSLVLLDLMLPRLSGFEVLETAVKENIDQQFLLVTAASDDDLQRIDRTLVVQIVRKPFELQELKDAVTTHVRSQSSLQRARSTARFRLRPLDLDEDEHRPPMLRAIDPPLEPRRKRASAEAERVTKGPRKSSDT